MAWVAKPNLQSYSLLRSNWVALQTMRKLLLIDMKTCLILDWDRMCSIQSTGRNYTVYWNYFTNLHIQLDYRNWKVETLMSYFYRQLNKIRQNSYLISSRFIIEEINQLYGTKKRFRIVIWIHCDSSRVLRLANCNKPCVRFCIKSVSHVNI